tara:strand:- start:447 stop:734 length:288 start_codon:yes stop_codon:yes gene_type:complete
MRVRPTSTLELSVKHAIAAIVLCLAAGVVYSGTTVTINGRTIQSAGNSIVITNDTMVVDGLGRSRQVIQGSGTSATENRNLSDFNLRFPAVLPRG